MPLLLYTTVIAGSHMVARMPIAQVVWLSIIISPFALVTIPLVVDAHAFILLSTLFAAILTSRFIYFSWIRYVRQHAMQTRIREMAMVENRPFILISRSYDQSKQFLTSAPIPNLSSDVYISLFDALIYDLSHSQPIVVLGDKDLHADDPGSRAVFVSAWPDNPSKVGVYNVQRQELIFGPSVSWDDIFVRLACAARFVLVVPALSEGVRREIALLREHNLGSKTVIYMWPTKGAHPYRPISADGSAWNALREPLAALGLDLPPHRDQGALLRLDDDFTIRTIYAPVQRKNILMAVIADDHRRDLMPLRHIAPVIRDYEIAADPTRYRPVWKLYETKD